MFARVRFVGERAVTLLKRGYGIGLVTGGVDYSLQRGRVFAFVSIEGARRPKTGFALLAQQGDIQRFRMQFQFGLGNERVLTLAAAQMVSQATSPVENYVVLRIDAAAGVGDGIYWRHKLDSRRVVIVAFVFVIRLCTVVAVMAHFRGAFTRLF